MSCHFTVRQILFEWLVLLFHDDEDDDDDDVRCLLLLLSVSLAWWADVPRLRWLPWQGN